MRTSNGRISWVRSKVGATISNTPTGRVRKVIFCGVVQPRRKKSLKERHLHDSRLIFTPKLKRTPLAHMKFHRSVVARQKITSSNDPPMIICRPFGPISF